MPSEQDECFPQRGQPTVKTRLFALSTRCVMKITWKDSYQQVFHNGRRDKRIKLVIQRWNHFRTPLEEMKIERNGETQSIYHDPQ